MKTKIVTVSGGPYPQTLCFQRFYTLVTLPLIATTSSTTEKYMQTANMLYTYIHIPSIFITLGLENIGACTDQDYDYIYLLTFSCLTT